MALIDVPCVPLRATPGERAALAVASFFAQVASRSMARRAARMARTRDLWVARAEADRRREQYRNRAYLLGIR